MLTQEQLEERLNFITGSDAAVICNKSRYKTCLQLWLEKTRRAEQEDISNEPYIKFGNYMEDGVARWFAETTSKQIQTAPQMLIHSDHTWMSGNVDRLIVGENAILECKTAMRTDDWGDDSNIIPDEYLLQVAHYCAVGNFDKAYIAVVFRLTGEFRWYDYERNLTLEKKLIDREYDFWNNNIKADIAPELKTADDILAFYKKTNPKPITATEHIEEYIEMYEAARIAEKDAIDLKEKYKDEIAVYMKDHDTIMSTQGEVLATWKYTNPIKEFDLKKFAEEEPLMYNKYVKKEKTQRRFVIKR